MKIILILLAILYALSPYDVIPDLLAGWGWLDDIAILGLLWRYLYKQRQKTGPFTGKTESRRTPKNRVQNPYTVLGISPDASFEEVRRAYRELAGQYHPDKVNHLGEELKALAEERFKEIQAAYDTITKMKR